MSNKKAAQINLELNKIKEILLEHRKKLEEELQQAYIDQYQQENKGELQNYTIINDTKRQSTMPEETIDAQMIFKSIKMEYDENEIYNVPYNECNNLVDLYLDVEKKELFEEENDDDDY